jgi:uncharacterized protein (TIGR03663 family)
MPGLLLAVLAALALRCPELAIRPMHNDEAVNAIKLRALWEKGSYQYDPQEYHGPTLPYASLLWVKLTGVPDFAQCNEAELRAVTVIFGVGLILLLPLAADGLGRRATVCAAFLTAVSPAMVFYSRYYIHEMLLVFFTFLALASGWRYAQSRKISWALLAGAAVGLMEATKETFVLAVAAAAGAIALNAFWSRAPKEKSTSVQSSLKAIAVALAAWLAVVVVLFTSFFTHARGPLDAVETYLPWLRRMQGASPHIHPWDFYLARVALFHSGREPWWSEGLILALACAGIVAAFMGRGMEEGQSRFMRFLAFYTVLLTVGYSVIEYKTPWCLLGFWHGMILLAGAGMVALVDWMRVCALKVAVVIALLAGAAQLAFQAWQSSFEFSSDPGNPYVYAQTSPDMLLQVERVKALAKLHPLEEQMVVKVMAPEGDYWPWPWYLRGFSNVGYYNEIPADPFAPVMIVSTKFQAALNADKTHVAEGINQMRPQVFFQLYVETNLWNAYVKANSAPPR